MPRVSVNVCCYNGEKYVAQALASVLAQTFADFEVVVIDDGSKDGTAALVKSFNDPRIKLHQQANIGLAASRNRALALSSGEFVALLDQDDLWEPDKLERQVAVMDAKPEVGVVYSDVLIVDERGAIKGKGRSGRYRRGRITESLLGGNYIFCPTVMFRRAVLEKTAGFRTDLKISEEYELYLRLSRLCEFDYVKRPLARYRSHAANTSKNMALDYAENVACLADFAAAEPDARLRACALRRADHNRLKLAALLIWNGRAGEAAEVLKALGARGPAGLLLDALSRAPSGLAKLLLLPLNAAGIVR